MVSFLGLSDTTCALIIFGAAATNFLNACAVARYARRKGHVTTDCGTALFFFIAFCFGLFSWVIFCCDSDSQPGINVNGVRVINVPNHAPYHAQQPSYGYYQQFNNPTEYSMQGQRGISYPPLHPTYAPPALQPSYYVQPPPVVAQARIGPAFDGSLLQASAPPLD